MTTFHEDPNLAQAAQVSEECVSDVGYLRSRSRWSEELELELIALHKAGNPPNVNEFGCTPETGKALLDAIKAALPSQV